MDEHRELNLAFWNDRVAFHAEVGYELHHYDDPSYVSDVVSFDRRYLPDVAGKRLVHLQCHIGTDTVSWARLGANVTGYDFSEPAIEAARGLARRAHVEAEFVHGEFYDAVQRLGDGRFDIVYTGVGALCWLPDIAGWARTVRELLAPGGRLYIREAHPILWALDDERDDDVLVVRYPYFETMQPLVFDQDDGTYVGPPTSFQHNVTHEWNHGIGEILSAVLDEGLEIRVYEEHREIEWRPWELFEATAAGKRYALPGSVADRVPLMYTLVAERPQS
ncbi:MAG: class I SAM-dependent methyltransferase [Actinobacteria bacterium]|nr:class I SAM-dependent methyltransferase [Actinomycetota bacterium]